MRPWKNTNWLNADNESISNPSNLNLVMQEPNPKKLPIYLPEFLTFGIRFGIALLYDGKVYDDFPGFC